MDRLPSQRLSPVAFLLKRQTWFWAGGALVASAGLLALRLGLDYRWTASLGVPVTLLCGYVTFWTFRHPKVYLGKGAALLSLILSGALTYMAAGELAHAFMWRRAFQLSKRLAVFEEPVEKWRISYPEAWSHDENRASGTVTHVFRPSRVAPAMYFSVTARPDVGTSDLGLIVENFFVSLPKDKEVQMLEYAPVTLPSGLSAYGVVYGENSRRVALKNKVLFVLAGTRLYFLTVGASPLWFDRHRDYLENLLLTLEVPPVGSASSTPSG